MCGRLGWSFRSKVLGSWKIESKNGFYVHTPHDCKDVIFMCNVHASPVRSPAPEIS